MIPHPEYIREGIIQLSTDTQERRVCTDFTTIGSYIDGDKAPLFEDYCHQNHDDVDKDGELTLDEIFQGASHTLKNDLRDFGYSGEALPGNRVKIKQGLEAKAFQPSTSN